MSATLLAPSKQEGAIVLRLPPTLRHMSEQEFFAFCQLNPDVRIERTSEGDLVIMAPVGGGGGKRSLALAGPFDAWVEADGSGVGFDSSTGFRLPNGAVRSPDLAWVTRSRWDALSEADQEEFPPLCPEFVVELRSRTDRLRSLQEKMEEYIANGARLGWLIDPAERKLYVYSPGIAVVCLDAPAEVQGDPVLPSFTLSLKRIWT